MKLKVLGRYTNAPKNVDVWPGDEIEVKDELGQWLQQDAPGCFAEPGKEQEAAEQVDDEQKPYDESPDGTTVKIDPLPDVVTGPDSGVTLTHKADAEEQARVSEEQEQRLADAEAEADVTFTPSPAFVEEVDEEELKRQKALDEPPADKQVRRSIRK